MRALGYLLACVCVGSTLSAQAPISYADAMKQLYNRYDAQSKTAQWVCPEEQTKADSSACRKENTTISVSVLLTTQVKEDGIDKTYFVTSSKPAKAPGEFDCHACAPEIGVIVFAWNKHRWGVESSNDAIGEFGEWGEPPEVNFVAAGPGKHGIVLSLSGEGQGYSSTAKILLVAFEKTVKVVWKIMDENDDAGAYAPTDKSAMHILYRATAAFRFDGCPGGRAERCDYYDIEVYPEAMMPRAPGPRCGRKTGRRDTPSSTENISYRSALIL